MAKYTPIAIAIMTIIIPITATVVLEVIFVPVFLSPYALFKNIL